MDLRIRLIAFILPFICPFFCLLRLNCVTVFSQELCKLESSNMIYICSMSDCIVGLRLRIMALILLFLNQFFFLFLYCMFTLKFCVRVFSGSVSARILKLGIHMDNDLLYCGIENQTYCSYSFFYPCFCLLRLNLCHSFLKNCAS